jgi:hypothetical protein
MSDKATTLEIIQKITNVVTYLVPLAAIVLGISQVGNAEAIIDATNSIISIVAGTAGVIATAIFDIIAAVKKTAS